MTIIVKSEELIVYWKEYTERLLMSTTPTPPPMSDAQVTAYGELVKLGLTATKQLLISLKVQGAPQDVIDGLTGAVTALQRHWNDDLTKANVESMRG